MRVFVLGSTGMLGYYVSNYFSSSNYEVVEVSRDGYYRLDALKADESDLKDLGAVEGDVIINCIGIIPHGGKKGDHEYIVVNSAFPHLVSDYCEKNKIHFIHITTDCVYSGLMRGPYLESATHDAEDIYGKSKSFGEPSNATVIRTSIIGE
jgi:dTDP-4-dehydrorhamnose reductase